MSRHLVVNTQVDRPIPRTSSQWQPSPETSAAIQEEDALALKQKNRSNTLYEEVEEEEEEEDDDEEEEEDDDDEDELDEDDDSTFTSSPSIPDENINFDLVYALHTFVATVEGQASVVKGDALTLLDDSNSYWWLVSVLKTSEVGYIPAENIETPFERLARLNKHRNAEMTSMDQAVHYIPNENIKKKGAGQRRVTMNKDLSVQAQIILTGDDEDHEVGEAYEEWEEDMADDASILTEQDMDDDDDNDDGEEEEYGQHVSSNAVGVPKKLQDQKRSAAAQAPAAAPQPLQSVNNNNDAVSSSSSSSAATTITTGAAAPTPRNSGDDKRPPSNTFWRLFSRNKKDNPKANSVIPARVSEDADSNSISSLASSIISEDKTATRNGQHHSNSNNATGGGNTNGKLTVLRVFAGNVNVGAMYHSMLVDAHTSAEQLLIQTMERFHIAQIEDKTAGRSSRAITPTNGSGVEYYLTVKAHNGDEITLAPQDKPLAIFQTLTAHLTTPMPSLTHVKQLSQSTPALDANRTKVAAARKGRFSEDSMIRFYLHKRIRRVNEREGQVYIKVSLYTDTKKPTNGNDNALFSTKNLRRKKPSAADASRERIDKLIAISASISIADLTAVALDKFHIVPRDNEHYRLAVASSQQKAEKLLNPSSKLIEVLHDDDATRDAGEKLFTLRKSYSHHHHSQSRSASRESQRSISKVSPEKTRRPQSYQRTPLSITIRDAKTEDALRRLDAALTALCHSKRRTDAKPAMAVVRNLESGVDILLSNGVLSNKPLSRNQMQYTVSVNANGQLNKPGLVAQKIIQHPLLNGNRTINSSLKNVTEADLNILVKCGMVFLEAHDRKLGRKPVPSALTGGGAAAASGADAATSAPSLDVPESSTGSLDDLEKEFQRIIAAHAF
ncbi:hypothetical protein BDB00DRAFT_23254 [Zychaea mexicana]|uniref:uncharacterized protein n=1 Tax=Zychaea mexicana TaxID=64656 RepID=UPI0022FE3AE8|nr:uncharacterized protein BDB00DRAFT_23254 [Zychaea mexicana]KAI9497295.1 hypothetical protein BDB00DRAFT_23254 [Zychaea mexicana]